MIEFETIVDMNDLPLGVKLAAVRRARGLTLNELEKISGIALQTINKIERGGQKPSLTTLEILCKSLQIDSSLVLDF
jgi:transcriptional regulator with XRE-family HTH domain